MLYRDFHSKGPLPSHLARKELLCFQQKGTLHCLGMCAYGHRPLRKRLELTSFAEKLISSFFATFLQTSYTKQAFSRKIRFEPHSTATPATQSSAAHLRHSCSSVRFSIVRQFTVLPLYPSSISKNFKICTSEGVS